MFVAQVPVLPLVLCSCCCSCTGSSSVLGVASQVAHCYPNETKTTFLELMDLLSKSFSVLQPPVRLVLVKALILMHNRGGLTSLQVTPFFLKLLRYHDKTVRQLVFQHILAGVLPRSSSCASSLRFVSEPKASP